MKVVCIDKVFFRDFHIEVDEMIEVEPYLTESQDNSFLENAYVFYKDGHTYFAERTHFITIEQWREQQLNKIL